MQLLDAQAKRAAGLSRAHNETMDAEEVRRRVKKGLGKPQGHRNGSNKKQRNASTRSERRKDAEL